MSETLTEAKRAELVRKAQERALEAIAAVKARETTAEREAIRTAAEAAILGKLSRSHVEGTDKKGRLIVRTVGEKTAAEKALDALR